MRDAEIRGWVARLIQTFGEPKPLADNVELEVLYRTDELAGMLQVIREKLRLNMKLRLGLANSGGPTGKGGRPAPAWVQHHGAPPLFGTQAFAEHRVTVYLRKQFIALVPFEILVCGMAHELSHVVLDSIGHPLRLTEEAVDLTAMLLGYRRFYLKGIDLAPTTVTREWENLEEAIAAGRPPELIERTTTFRHGYLSPEEVRYAARLMQT